MVQNSSITGEDEKNVVQIDVYFRFERRTEKIVQEHFTHLKMYDYQLISGGQRATHLVEQVVYGAEFIFSMRTAVGQCETKENVEKSLLNAVNTYIDEAINPKTTSLREQPEELNNFICTNFCTLKENCEVKPCSSIKQSCEWLRETVGFGKEISGIKWQAIEIVLRYIPYHIGAQVLVEMTNDFNLAKERNKTQMIRLKKETSEMSDCPLINCVPPFKKIVHHCLTCLSEFKKKLNQYDEKDVLKLEYPEKVCSEMEEMYHILDRMIDWLLKRRIEIDVICSLLKDSDLNISHLSEIEGQKPKDNYEGAKVFLLEVHYVEDPLLERMKKFIGIQDPSFKLPVFPISAVGEYRLNSIKKKLKTFSKNSSFDTKFCYLIGLVSSSSSAQRDGEIKNLLYNSNETNDTISHQPCISSSPDPVSCGGEKSSFTEDYPSAKDKFQTELKKDHQTETGTSSDLSSPRMSSETKEVQKAQHDDGPKTTESLREKMFTNPSTNQVDTLDGNLNEKLYSDSPNNTAASRDSYPEKNRQLESKNTAGTVADRIGKGQSNEIAGKPGDNMPINKQLTEGMSQTNPTIANSPSHRQDGNSAMTQLKQVPTKEINEKMYQGPHQDITDKKIDEIFTQSNFAKLIKGGQPMVYELNAVEISIGKDLRCFHIPERIGDVVTSLQGSQNHKVIILMGATGSGKSTLINGMVNYILGVQWKDPFRFKCVREDDSVARNEAHSQTNSVTAYTLHHHKEMAVPYSITIIDTPGYGDTRGTKRDKEITGSIHHFITQQRVPVDQIHAICFVAASGDSRLTHTQRYVLDSVLSIFGKDVKENIRLLVTFADNALPPVVDACRAAHFPVSSTAADIMYSKFNSSVLYASHDKSEKGRIPIEEIVWNMGQKNFKKFFTMLEGMNGRDLKSTREVIQNRQPLEQSLKDIENQLEDCFETIEKLNSIPLREFAGKRTTDGNYLELETAETKVLSLLEQASRSNHFLDSESLRYHSTSPAEYLSLIRSRITEEQKPGYEIRLQMLLELQNRLPKNNPRHQKSPADYKTQSVMLSGTKPRASYNHGKSYKQKNQFSESRNSSICGAEANNVSNKSQPSSTENDYDYHKEQSAQFSMSSMNSSPDEPEKNKNFIQRTMMMFLKKS